MNKELVYTKLGMALVCAQRVEFLAGSLVNHLKEFDETVYGISSTEFLENSKNRKMQEKLLGKFSISSN